MTITLEDSYMMALSMDVKRERTIAFLRPLFPVSVSDGGDFVLQTKGWTIRCELPGAPFRITL